MDTNFPRWISFTYAKRELDEGLNSRKAFNYCYLCPHECGIDRK